MVNTVKISAILSVMLFVLTFSFTAGAADQLFFYHTDPVGTPLAMTDVSGAVVWKADYKPFGEENSITGSAANSKRFVGKEKDTETGLDYFGARYMNDKIGRFIAVDPVGAVDSISSKTNEMLLQNPQRINPYVYALDNPYKFFDPDGNEVRWVDAVKSGVGIASNGFGIIIGGGLVLAPEPALTKAVGVAVSVKSWYGFSVNTKNFWNAVNDQNPYSTGGLGTDLAAAIAPGNRNAKAVGTISELSLDLLTGVVGRSATNSIGPLNKYSIERAFVRNPAEQGNIATNVQLGDLIKTGAEAYNDNK